MNPLRPSILFWALCLPCAAQATFTAGKIIFSESGPYTQSQLEDTAGMHAGTKFTTDELGSAAQRLMDTGFFTDVGATLSGNVKSITVLFRTKPLEPSQMLRVGFKNFIWLTQDEIETTLRAKAPLFSGYLPENSPLQDVFAQALKQALAAKGINADVEHDVADPSLVNPYNSIEFRTENPVPRVDNIKLSGISTALVPLVQKAVNLTVKSPYDDGFDGNTTVDRILEPLFDAGYVEASLSDVTGTHSAGDPVSVLVAGKLVPGDIYRVSSLSFAGTPLLSATEFAKAQKLHPGDIASRKALLETLAPVDAAYRRLGYMDVFVNAAPTFDKSTHQVSYTVSVTPGKQYRVHQVTPNNLDSAALAEFNRGFLMKSGELYNPEYLQGFLRNNTALTALQGYSASYKAYADPNTHTVDLVLTFFRTGRQ